MKKVSPALRARYKHVFNGGSVTTAELLVLDKRIVEINDAIDKCLPSRDYDVMVNLHNEVCDILTVMETSWANHPDREIDL